MTQEVFDRIAPGWYHRRHRSIFLEELGALARRWRGGRLLNIGCGHGADFVPFRERFELHGLDISGRMLALAVKYASKYGFTPALVQGDASCLPYGDAVFDWAIAVATYHHIQPPEARLAALAELRRVLKPGGEAFITVWNRGQPRFWFKGRDTLVPWRTGGETLRRYYHLFTYRELEGLAKRAGLEVRESHPERRYRLPVKFFSRNICLLVRKPA